MGIKYYFSKDENKRANFIFNLIAPIYGRIAKKIAGKYDSTIELIDSQITIKGKSVLDIGTGTGAWAKKFQEKKAEKIVGVDLADKMIVEAQKVFSDIEFFKCNAELLEKIPDNSFDIVTASFVLHGVKKERRKLILQQIHRVTKKHIIVQDFYGKVGFFTKLLEAIERSDMPYFKNNFENELKNYFTRVKVYDFKRGKGIYFAEK